MTRPKTVLWVDDEADSLEAHILYLEENGYRVETATHGDDALALLQGKSYGIILLDEHMPGRRGLELVGEIRSLDPVVPLVMVTKSEEAGTIREAIGLDTDDYLVKPVSPRQVLTVVTRLVEGEQIRRQRTARDFVTRFRELEQRRSSELGWREWIDLVSELSYWEVRLSERGDRALQDALATYQTSLRIDFANFVREHYPQWLTKPEGDRPPLSVDLGSEFLVPLVKQHESVLFIVIDCMRMDQWEMLKPRIAEIFDMEVSHYFSILPTATPYSRNAIFSGLFPVEIASRYPQWWREREDTGLNAHESEMFQLQLAELIGSPTRVRYEKLSTGDEGRAMLRRLSGHLSEPGVTALVFNFVDQLTHGRSENEILFEVARDSAALRGLTKTWFLDSALLGALKEANRRKVPVLLTTDHGSIHCMTPATVFAKRDATTNLRYKFGEDLRAEKREDAILVESLESWGLPKKPLGVRLLMATADRFFVYPTKLRQYQSRYRGAFLHGGITPEEVIIPIALLTPRGVA
ncbi:MAG: bifunctional response regulator/alkaline phosphatase family protein [Gemmatimonadales bacterium]